jgi:hypothetical protein
MQIETKEVIKKEYVNCYVAIDGSRFNSEVECQKYEESASMVAYSKYSPLILFRKSEYEIYGTGSEEYEIDIVKIKCLEDIDTILHMYSLYHPSYDKDTIAQERIRLEKWFNDGEVLFIGRGCGYDNYDSFVFINTMNGVINHIKKACNEEES